MIVQSPTRCLLFISILYLCVCCRVHASPNVGAFAETEHRAPDETEQESRHFRLISSEEIRNRLLEWSNKYPELCSVTTSQDAYGLPRAGGANDCPFDEGNGCKNYILTIQDFVSNPEGSESSKRLPEVFLSGLLHGNERVGPTAVIETAALLLSAADCEAKPNIAKKHADGHLGHSLDNQDDWPKEVRKAKRCRAELRKQGVNDVQRRWLARLVATRRLVIVPTTNALGYFRNSREEDGVDPNRDFPYDLQDPKLCMQTVAGRTLNEIFREHMFQLSLTFHGGMEVVAFEWGAPTYLKHFSPDDEAQAQIAEAYSRYGGGWKGTQAYDVGTMNDKVYYVRGGMEDWAYAGSWDPERVIPCTPESYNGYDKAKTVYNNSTLRVFNMLVETSKKKEPPRQMLGSTLDLLDAETTGNGHVSRNVRLSLLATDLVEPYVSILGVNDLSLSDDLVPLTARKDRNCQKSKTIMIPSNVDEVVVYWTAGGAMNVDKTAVWYGKWDDDLPKRSSLNCEMQPNTDEIQASLRQGTPLSVTSGTGFFSEAGPQPHPQKDGLDETPNGPLFSARIDVSKYKPLDQVVVVASARVDQSWRNQPENISPQVMPQSHIVNARTDPTWRHESAGKIIQGRLDWYSLPLTIVIGDYEDSVGLQAGREVGTIELSNRFGHTTGLGGGVTPKKARSGDTLTLGWNELVAIAVVCTLGLVLCLVCVRRNRQREHRKLVSELYEEEGKFAGTKPYSDDVIGEEELEDAGYDSDRAGHLELKEYI